MKKTNITYLTVFITYIILLTAIVSYMLFLKNFIEIPMCPVYKYLGLYCPACGGTRAVISFFHFHIIDSILYNPIVLYTIITSTLYLIIETINFILKKSISLPWKILIYIGLAILVINWITQNLFILHIL